MANFVDALGLGLDQGFILVKRLLLKEAADIIGRFKKVVVEVLTLHYSLHL